MSESFDNTKPNIILISDHTEKNFLMKTFGPYKVARELRLAGFEVAVLHHAHIFNYEEIKNILKTLISDNTLFVGVNNVFYQEISDVALERRHPKGVGKILPHGLDKNNDIKSFIKSLNPNCKLVIGGPTADANLINNIFDFVVIGYADLSIVNLANHLLNQVPLLHSHKSILGPVIINDPKAEGFDFQNSKMDYKPYDCILSGETMLLEISRGCIFNCAFCSFPLNGKKKLDYIKRSDLLLDEFLDNYKKYNVTKYVFLDDTFNDSVDKVKMIYNISKQLPFKLEFWAYMRLDLLAAHPETVDMVFDAGLRGCHFGIETLNKRTASIIGKGQNKEKQLETIRYIKRKWGDNVLLHGSFITGLPHESKESMIETFELFLNDTELLDSFEIHSLGLDDVTSTEKDFRSELSKNPTKYGYFNLKKFTDPALTVLDWTNEHLTIYEAEAIADEYTRKAHATRNKVIAQDVFFMGSLGYTIDDFKSILKKDVNWNEVYSRKVARANEYKEQFYNAFNIVWNTNKS